MSIPIKPLQVFCRNILPTVYDDSLDYYEQLCKISTKLNEVIASQNEVVEEFVKIKEWVDTQLEIYSKNQLIEWKNDGTLASIINEELFGELNTKLNNNITQTNANTANIASNLQKINQNTNDIVANAKDINTISNTIRTYQQIKFFSLYSTGVAGYLSLQSGPTTKYMLIDGGTNTDRNYPFYWADGTSWPSNDAQTTYNKIVQAGITHLDYAFISHFHDDHIGGFGYCLTKGLIDSNTTVYIGGYIDSAQAPSNTDITQVIAYQNEFKQLQQRYGFKVVVLSSNTSYNLNGTILTFFNCQDNYYKWYSGGIGSNANFYAAAFRIRSLNFLYTSDITPEVQADIYPNMASAKFFTVPHHGADTSINTAFLNRTQPESMILIYGGLVRATIDKGYWQIWAYEHDLPILRTQAQDITLNNFNGEPAYFNSYISTYPVPQTAGVFAPSINYEQGDTERTVVVGNILNPNFELFSLSNNVFTAKVAGFYAVQAQINGSVNADSTQKRFYFILTAGGKNLVTVTAQQSNNPWLQINYMFNLAVGEQFYFKFETDDSPFTTTLINSNLNYRITKLR